MPHHPQLFEDVSEGVKPGESDRGDQEEHGVCLRNATEYSEMRPFDAGRALGLHRIWRWTQRRGALTSNGVYFVHSF